MWVVVGLGNPGKQYAETRHNVGFMVVDELAQRFPSSSAHPNEYSHIRQIHPLNQSVLLVQPQTFMNCSGLAVNHVLSRHPTSLDQIIIILDDLDLPPGTLRIRRRGGNGGHKGLKSIIEHLGETAFIRVRIGIGRPHVETPPLPGASHEKTIEHVLQPFEDDVRPMMYTAIKRASDAIELIISGQLEKAMNIYNRRESQSVSENEIHG